MGVARGGESGTAPPVAARWTGGGVPPISLVGRGREDTRSGPTRQLRSLPEQAQTQTALDRTEDVRPRTGRSHKPYKALAIDLLAKARPQRDQAIVDGLKSHKRLDDALRSSPVVCGTHSHGLRGGIGAGCFLRAARGSRRPARGRVRALARSRPDFRRASAFASWGDAAKRVDPGSVACCNTDRGVRTARSLPPLCAERCPGLI